MQTERRTLCAPHGVRRAPYENRVEVCHTVDWQVASWIPFRNRWYAVIDVQGNASVCSYFRSRPSFWSYLAAIEILWNGSGVIALTITHRHTHTHRFPQTDTTENNTTVTTLCADVWRQIYGTTAETSDAEVYRNATVYELIMDLSWRTT